MQNKWADRKAHCFYLFKWQQFMKYVSTQFSPAGKLYLVLELLQCFRSGSWPCSDLRKGIYGVSCEFCSSVYLFCIFWHLLQWHSSEKWSSPIKENNPKTAQLIKHPKKVLKKIRKFLFSFYCCSCLKRTDSFLRKKQISMMWLNTVKYFHYISRRRFFFTDSKLLCACMFSALKDTLPGTKPLLIAFWKGRWIGNTKKSL